MATTLRGAASARLPTTCWSVMPSSRWLTHPSRKSRRQWSLLWERIVSKPPPLRLGYAPDASRQQANRGRRSGRSPRVWRFWRHGATICFPASSVTTPTPRSDRRRRGDDLRPGVGRFGGSVDAPRPDRARPVADGCACRVAARGHLSRSPWHAPLLFRMVCGSLLRATGPRFPSCDAENRRLYNLAEALKLAEQRSADLLRSR